LYPEGTSRAQSALATLEATNENEFQFRIDACLWRGGNPVTLDRLAIGQDGVIVSIDGRDPVARRLADLGLVPKTLIRAVRRAPLGDPTVYELRGYRLCLRRGEAARVEIAEPVGANRSAPARGDAA
jgi:ferrous iron transport protein A